MTAGRHRIIIDSRGEGRTIYILVVFSRRPVFIYRSVNDLPGNVRYVQPDLRTFGQFIHDPCFSGDRIRYILVKAKTLKFQKPGHPQNGGIHFQDYFIVGIKIELHRLLVECPGIILVTVIIHEPDRGVRIIREPDPGIQKHPEERRVSLGLSGLEIHIPATGRGVSEIVMVQVDRMVGLVDPIVKIPVRNLLFHCRNKPLYS